MSLPLRRSPMLVAALLLGVVLRLLVVANALPLAGPGRFADVVGMWAWVTGAPSPLPPAGGVPFVPTPYQLGGAAIWCAARSFEPRVVLVGVGLLWGVLGLCLPWFSYRLVRRATFGSGAAALTAAVVAVSAPLLTAVPPELTPLALGGPLCGAGFFLIVRAIERGSALLALSAGLAIGSALLTSLSAVPLAVAGILALAVPSRPVPLRCRGQQVGAFLLGTAVVLAAYPLLYALPSPSFVVPADIVGLAVLAVIAVVTLGLIGGGLRQALRDGWEPVVTVAFATIVAVIGIGVANQLSGSFLSADAGAFLMVAVVPVSVWSARAFSRFATDHKRRSVAAEGAVALMVLTLAMRPFVVAPRPTQVALHDNALAVLTHVAGFPASARTTFERLAAAGLPAAHENLASLDTDDGHLWPALRHLQAALAAPRSEDASSELLQRRRAEYYNGIAVIAHRLGWSRLGQKAAKRATRADPTSRAAAFNEGVLLLETDDPAAAERHFAEHALWIGQLPAVPLLHATAAQRAGDCAKAKELLALVRPPTPARPAPFLQSITGSLDDVAMRRQRRIQALPPYADSGYVQAVCEAGAGRVRAAATELRRQLTTGELPPAALADHSWRQAARGRLTPQVLPNIIVILIDTLRADHVGAYGYPRPTTPNLDRLAANGVRFTNAYSTSSWTGPAVASLFSGLLPGRHGFTAANTAVKTDIPLLAEELRRVGYQTAALSANFVHVTPYSGLARGFDEFRVMQYTATQTTRQMRIRDVDLRGATARELTTAAGAWLQRSAKPPFFLYVHYIDPHSGYQPPPPYRALFAAADANDQAGVTADDVNALERRGERLPAAELQNLINLYDGEIRFADTEIGHLLDGLEARGYLDNSLVVVTADHGEEFEDHGHFFHGFTLYEEQVRVPLILYGRGTWALAPTVLPQLVQLTDVFPTLAELTGANVPPGLDGESLLPLLVPRGLYRRDVVRTELPPDALLEGRMHPHRHALAARDAAAKVLAAPDGKLEVYRLGSDPGEKHDLGSAGAANLESLTRAVSGRSARASAGRQAVLDDAQRERLRALGYLP